MIDTAAKRNSAIATRRLPWMRRFAPIPDGTTSQEERRQLVFAYSGILTEGVPADAWTVPQRKATWTCQERVIDPTVPNRRIDWTGDNR